MFKPKRYIDEKLVGHVPDLAEILIDSYYGLIDNGPDMILLLAVGSLDSQCKIAVVRFNAGKRGERKELSALPFDGEMECNNCNI